MKSQKKFEIGDLFLIPLENDLNGVGRILRSFKKVILVEFYKIKPIKSTAEFNFLELKNEKPLITHWCYDISIKRGGWKIFDNQPVPKELDMPYFWTQDAGDMKYYIRKGTDEPFYIGERIEISKEELDKYDPEGLGNDVTERNRYIRKLKAAGLL